MGPIARSCLHDKCAFIKGVKGCRVSFDFDPLERFFVRLPAGAHVSDGLIVFRCLPFGPMYKIRFTF